MAAGASLLRLWLFRKFLQTDTSNNSMIKNIFIDESK